MARKKEIISIEKINQFVDKEKLEDDFSSKNQEQKRNLKDFERYIVFLFKMIYIWD